MLRHLNVIKNYIYQYFINRSNQIPPKGRQKGYGVVKLISGCDVKYSYEKVGKRNWEADTGDK